MIRSQVRRRPVVPRDEARVEAWGGCVIHLQRRALALLAERNTPCAQGILLALHVVLFVGMLYLQTLGWHDLIAGCVFFITCTAMLTRESFETPIALFLVAKRYTLLGTQMVRVVGEGRATGPALRAFVIVNIVEFCVLDLVTVARSPRTGLRALNAALRQALAMYLCACAYQMEASTSDGRFHDNLPLSFMAGYFVWHTWVAYRVRDALLAEQVLANALTFIHQVVLPGSWLDARLTGLVLVFTLSPFIPDEIMFWFKGRLPWLR
jgi:hypothetical protein